MFTRDIHSHQETTEAAVYDLNQSILLCRRQKEKLLCVIVGYGSKGKTHKIQSAALESRSSLYSGVKKGNLYGIEGKTFSSN